MSKETFTREEARELFITAWCASQYRGQLSAKGKASNFKKKVAGNKFDRHVAINYDEE